MVKLLTVGTGAIAAAAVLVAPPALQAQDDELERCEAPVGTLAVVEPQDVTIQSLSRYGLGSPTTLIRMMVQETNCFIVVERGAGMQNMMQERQLAESGELAQGSNMGGGQMQAADFVMTPNVLFSEDNAGGVGGVVGGVLGRRAPVIGAVGGALKFKEASTSMLVSNTRSGIQVVSAEGKARKTDFKLGALGFGGGVLGAVGGYTNTNEGKVIAASFLDNLNSIVESVREDPSLPPLSPEEIQARRSGAPAAGSSFTEGDIVAPKIDNIQLLTEPSDGATVVATLARTDDLVFLGQERDGFLQVQGSAGMGWVKGLLVTKR